MKMSEIGTSIKDSKNFNNNVKSQKVLLNKIMKIAKSIELGGGKIAVGKQHSKGRLTVRERVNELIDNDTIFLKYVSLQRMICTKNMEVLHLRAWLLELERLIMLNA